MYFAKETVCQFAIHISNGFANICCNTIARNLYIATLWNECWGAVDGQTTSFAATVMREMLIPWLVSLLSSDPKASAVVASSIRKPFSVRYYIFKIDSHCHILCFVGISSYTHLSSSSFTSFPAPPTLFKSRTEALLFKWLFVAFIYRSTESI